MYYKRVACDKHCEKHSDKSKHPGWQESLSS